MTRVQVDIVSDVMCPWCYIGKKRYEAALAALDPDIGVDTHWRPYQLDPTLPPEGKPRDLYLAEKFGGLERARELYANIEAAGRGAGIPFRFDTIGVSPNTLDAHRLIRWARTAGEGVQDRVVDRLFALFFLEGRNIGDHAELVDVARQCGMDPAIVETLLASDSDKDAVSQEIALARSMGVSGVPCFILQNKYAVVGAQDPATLAEAIAEVASGA
ncbi:DsbA family oxidoreductase [Oricola sp.]|uniref:DsbA family oxidoreductase n=1 Tax=Oricola sp. TaxID=1979950 RepID=UPI0025FDED4F|nr:DsbA family oxidoreductase [Oricola sp.]